MLQCSTVCLSVCLSHTGIVTKLMHQLRSWDIDFLNQELTAATLGSANLGPSTFLLYEGRSINKFQNLGPSTFASVLKIGKIRNIRFVGNLILNIRTTFLDGDVIIVTSCDERIQCIVCIIYLLYVLFSPSVCYRNSQVINSIRTTEKKKKLNTLMLRL